MLVIFAAVLLVRETAAPERTVDEINSPTLPAAALSLVVVPTRLAWLRVGVVPKTRAPLPVSLEITPASSAEVVDANCARLDVVKPHVGQVRFPVVALRTIGEEAVTANVPEVLGRVRVGVPAVF